MPREPGYRLHKPTGQAYVYLGGRMFYLGKYSSKESREKYDRLKSEWLLNRHSAKFTQSGWKTMAQVAVAYLDYAQEYYAQSSEFKQMKLVLKPIEVLYPLLPSDQFGPADFKAVRSWWLSKDVFTGKNEDGSDKPYRKCSRQYCNKQMGRLLQVIKWGVSEGMIPPAVYQAVKCVPPLKRGRVKAPETKPVKPVDPKLVEDTLGRLPRVVADMVRFQLLTGCRPGEVCKLKPSMVDRADKNVWAVRLDHHKTAHHGRDRTIFVGPKAQKILAPYLLRAADSFCFSPAEAQEQRFQARADTRVTPENQGNRKGYSKKTRARTKYKRMPGEHYTTQSYGKAIKYACNKGEMKLPSWAPNQLRHLRATEIRSLFGLEEVASILGHADIAISQVYAEKDIARAKRVAGEIG